MPTRSETHNAVTEISPMTSKTWLRAGIPALLAAICAAGPALAAPTINKGDTAWMMTATVLVLVMTVPGLALFYAGMVRAKNALSVLMHVLYTVCIVFTIWMLYGYSLTFTGGGDFIGGLTKAFMAGIASDTPAGTFSVGVAIPEPVFVVFQMTFAAITAALIVGAFAERMKFSALVIFIPLWITFVYFPIAHMVWYWAGPDAIDAAAKALAAATDAAAKAKAQAALDEVLADAGYLFKAGAIDFAGGTVVHINSGIAGLVGAIMVGKRVGHGKDLMPPHSLPLTFTGAMLLWFGWFGFNAGSAGAANGQAANAFVVTNTAAAAAALSWMFASWLLAGKPSVIGAAAGAVAGLVAITPASGFVEPMEALVIGGVAGVVCYLAVRLRARTSLDDSLDVVAVHGVGGTWGALATGIFAAATVGGFDGLIHGEGSQVLDQLAAIGVVWVYSFVVTAVILKVLDLTMGLRVSDDEEELGLDVTQHGERGYVFDEAGAIPTARFSPPPAVPAPQPMLRPESASSEA